MRELIDFLDSKKWEIQVHLYPDMRSQHYGISDIANLVFYYLSLK